MIRNRSPLRNLKTVATGMIPEVVADETTAVAVVDMAAATETEDTRIS